MVVWCICRMACGLAISTSPIVAGVLSICLLPVYLGSTNHLIPLRSRPRYGRNYVQCSTLRVQAYFDNPGQQFISFSNIRVVVIPI